MNRYEILSKLIETETGRYFDGASIWKEIQQAVGAFEGEYGEHWITGQDDILMKWEYELRIERSYDEEFDQWETDIHLLSLKIEDKKTHETWHVQVEGAVL